MKIEKLFGQSIIWRSIYFITALGTNILFSRYLQAGNSGTVLYLANVFSFVSLLLGLSLESGLTYFASKQIISYGKLVLFSLLWVGAIAGAGIVTSGYFLTSILSNIALPADDLKWYAVVYVSGLMLINFFSVLFYSKNNYLLPNIILSAINIGVIFLIALHGFFSLRGNAFITDLYFYSTFLQGLLLFVIFIFRYNVLKSVSLPSVGNSRKLIQYSALALGANIIFFLINRIDFYFVERYCSKTDLGNYILVSRLGQMLLIIPQILASVIFPQVAKGSYSNAQMMSNVLVIGRLLARFYIVALLLLIISGKWLFPFVFGPSFDRMYGLMMIFMPGFFAFSYLAVISAFFLGDGHVKVNLAGTFIALIIVMIGDILMVKNYGVYVAAVVSSMGYILNLLYAIFIFKKKFQVPFPEFFKWQKHDLAWIKSLIKT
ncbi:MAG: hypothetical protein ABI921_04490 [Panacibacter sp.]